MRKSKDSFYFINLVFITSSQNPKKEQELEVKEITPIVITSLNLEKNEIILYSFKRKNLSSYVLKEENSRIFYSLSGIEIEAEIPLKLKLLDNFLNKKHNTISLYCLEVEYIW